MIKKMNVIDLDTNRQNLLIWANAQLKHLKLTEDHYCLNTILQSGHILQILKSLNSTAFNQTSGNLESTQYILILIEQILNKQCQVRIKLPLKNKIILEGNVQLLMSLVFYVCLHSLNKNQFISRVIILPENVQIGLMNILNKIGESVQNISSLKSVLFRVQELEQQAEKLRKQLNFKSKCEQNNQIFISQLEQQLAITQQKVKNYKKQKQTVLQTLKLTHISEYLTEFQQMQSENQVLTKYVSQLELSNEQMENTEQQLKQCIQNQMSVISDLNEEITHIKEKYFNLKNQKIDNAVEETCDASRSFGTQLTSRENLEISHIEKRGKITRFSEVQQWFDDEENINNEELLNQITQLRKYNAELMQKLEGVYTTIQSLSEESTLMREQNKALTKQNKHYKNKVRQITRLHKEFEKNYFGKMI